MIRSHLWEPGAWAETGDVPTLAERVADVADSKENLC
jgi:hypothetical protein